MPRSALEYVQVDHIASLAEMGALLGGLVSSTVAPAPRRRVTPGLEQEVKLVEVEKQDMTAPPEVGNPSYFSCPDCGGVLFEVDDEGLLRYRCRTGHGYTSKSLEVGQHQKLDSALWAAVRALEENAALARRLAARARERNHLLSAQRYEARASAAGEQALLVRQVALGGSPPESAPGSEAGKGEETQETG
jgi:two-component system chemotaxis response regulator CheB